MSADKCIELLQQKLAQYGLDLLKDIVGIMTEGASVMKKVGRILPVSTVMFCPWCAATDCY